MVSTTTTSASTSAPAESSGGLVRMASESVKHAVTEVYEYRVKPTGVVERASESYESFKKTYPHAGETLGHAERAVSSAVSAAASRGEQLVTELDTRINRQYETRIKDKVDSVASTVDEVKKTATAEWQRDEVQQLRSSSVSFFEALFNVILCYALRLLEFLDDKLDKHLPDTDITRPAIASTKSPAGSSTEKKIMGDAKAVLHHTLVLVEKLWQRLYTRLAAKAEVEARPVKLTDSMEDKFATLIYVLMVIDIGMLCYAAEYASTYGGLGAPLVRGFACVTRVALDAAKPHLPGAIVKTPVGETVGVLPTSD